MRQIDSGATAVNVEDSKSLEKALAVLKAGPDPPDPVDSVNPVDPPDPKKGSS